MDGEQDHEILMIVLEEKGRFYMQRNREGKSNFSLGATQAFSWATGCDSDQMWQ
jgi:hypothetical protein